MILPRINGHRKTSKMNMNEGGLTCQDKPENTPKNLKKAQ